MTMIDITEEYISGSFPKQFVGTPNSLNLSYSVLSSSGRRSRVHLLITSFKFYMAFVPFLLSSDAEDACVGHIFLASPHLHVTGQSDQLLSSLCVMF